jgi:hypothetical protein
VIMGFQHHHSINLKEVDQAHLSYMTWMGGR